MSDTLVMDEAIWVRALRAGLEFDGALVVAWFKRRAMANCCLDNLSELHTTTGNKLGSAQKQRPSIIAVCLQQPALW